MYKFMPWDEEALASAHRRANDLLLNVLPEAERGTIPIKGKGDMTTWFVKANPS